MAKKRIETQLTLDDAASKSLEKIKGGFESLKERVMETGHEMVGMAKQAATFAIGFQLSSAIDSVKEFGVELVHGASQLEEERKELAGLLTLSDKGGASFEDLRDKAGELNERFEQLAISTGNSKRVLIDAFGDIAARSTQSAEHSADMVEKMSIAAKALPGGISTMANAWKDLEVGVVRPRNAIVQLIRQTGIASGSAKDVAKNLNAMMQAGKQEEVFKLAEAAVNKMATRMKDVPLTFDQMLESLKGYREMFMETMGAPILRAIGPQFDKLAAYLQQHREEIIHVATVLGTRVGEWVKKAAEMIKEGFEYLETHADEIMDAIETGAHALKETIAFIVDHKELLLAIFAGYKGAQLGTSLAGGLAGNLPGLGSAMGRGVASLMSQTGMGAGGALAATGALAVIDAAVLAELQSQTAALEKESGLTTSESIFSTGDLFKKSDALADLRAEVEAMNDPARQSAQQLKFFAQKIDEYGKVLEKEGASSRIEKEIQQARQMSTAKAETAEQLEGLQKQLSMAAVAGYDSDFMGPQLDLAHRFADVYKQMAAVNAQAADAAAKQILEGNQGLLLALGATGNNVEEALDKLKNIAKPGAGEAATKLPTMNFGPSTFNLKQDFRDTDPDRVALIFRKDIAKQATNRTASRVGTPFGF